ncbi:MAG: right-handed parallel beta-helix repeat-containing protein [Acidimicrobiia bacterium]
MTPSPTLPQRGREIPPPLGRGLGGGVLVLAGLLAAGWWIVSRPAVIEVPGDASTVGEALAAAPEGAVVRLAPGRYEESLVVQGPVTIEGPATGQATIVGRPGQPVITVTGTRDVTLQGLTITGGELGVLIEDSEGVLVADNLVTGNSLRGVKVVFGSARIVGNVVADTFSPYGKGIHVANAMSRSPSVVEGNLVEGSGSEGILTNLVRVVVEGNRVLDNGSDGIAVSEMSHARVLGNTVAGNGRAGIYVVDMSMADLERNLVEGNRSDGVRLEFHAQARLLGNEVVGNEGCPVATGTSSAVFQRDNRLDGGAGCPSPEPLALNVQQISPRGLQVILLTGLVLLLVPLLVGGRRWPAFVLAAAAAVQVVHQFEHVVQVIQAHALAGAVLDTEWVHLGFNSVLLVALLMALAGYGWRRLAAGGLGGMVLLAGTALQGYHQVEHLVKIFQHVTLGSTPAPGILGQSFDLVWLHFSINLVVTGAVLVGFLALGTLSDLRSARPKLLPIRAR